jgi:hypothetical protein
MHPLDTRMRKFVQSAELRFPSWTIQILFELSPLAYSGDIWKELEKMKKMSRRN